MAGDSRRVALGDVADLLTGFPFRSAAFTDDPDHVRLLRGDNIAQGQTRWDGVKRWPSDAVSEYEEYQLRPGDVVLAMDRPWIEAGLKHATLTEADCPSLLVQRVARLRARLGVDQRFLGYVVRSPDFTNYVLAIQTGTAVPHISAGQIKAYGFTLPPIKQQAVAAELLGSLDDKIELNRRKAKSLTEMAHALFKSWFIDFDPVRAKIEGRTTRLSTELSALFPSTFGEDGLPAGWRFTEVGSLFEVRGGNTPRTENEEFWNGTHEWATPRDLSGLAIPVLLRTGRRLTDLGLGQVSSGLLPPGSLLLSTRAPIGYLAFTTAPTAINQGFAGFARTSVSTAYAWTWCQANLEMLTGNASGSTFAEISKAVLRRLPMLAPTPAILDAFAIIVDPLVEEIVAAAKEMQVLAELRDVLLPRLISGELHIDDTRKKVSAA